jgi:hypothetical protein
VRRVLVLLLIPSLIATSGLASLLHTHAYDDHDHPEHHHGLSAHGHDAARSHPDDGTAHLEGCAAGKHILSFAFICAAPPQVHVIVAELAVPATAVPEIRLERTTRHADVRVHGPPTQTQSSPRAPPLIAHA